jgi:hypothetical protein
MPFLALCDANLIVPETRREFTCGRAIRAPLEWHMTALRRCIVSRFKQHWNGWRLLKEAAFVRAISPGDPN